MRQASPAAARLTERQVQHRATMLAHLESQAAG
jgi:hypothetical protein